MHVTKDLEYKYPLTEREADKISDAVRIIHSARDSDLPRNKKERLKQEANYMIREAVSDTHNRA